MSKQHKFGILCAGFSLIIILYLMQKPQPHVLANEVYVEVVHPKWRNEAKQLTLIGTLHAAQSTNVSSKISGQIATVLVRSGQTVQKGDLLFSLENAALKATLAHKLATLKFAETTFARYQTLFAKKQVSKAIYEQHAQEFNAAKADLAYQTALLDNTYIRAPFSGTVGIRQVNLGQYIAAGEALINLQMLAPLYLDFQLPEKYLAYVQLNQTIQFTEPTGQQSLNAVVQALDTHLDNETHTRLVRAKVVNPKHLLPGMMATVTLNYEPKRNLILPESAIVYDIAGEFVYRIVSAEAKKTKITVGNHRDGLVSILAGIQQQDEIIVAGQQKIRPRIRLHKIDRAF